MNKKKKTSFIDIVKLGGIYSQNNKLSQLIEGKIEDTLPKINSHRTGLSTYRSKQPLRPMKIDNNRNHLF